MTGDEPPSDEVLAEESTDSPFKPLVFKWAFLKKSDMTGMIGYIDKGADR